MPHFHGEDAPRGWQRVIEDVHRAGGKMAPQLWHVGVRPPKPDWTPPQPFEGPSGLLPMGDHPKVETAGVEMTDADIADTIDAYARAAAEAKSLGFDCVEIHGAHGYLIDQFFWERTNARKDRYGGRTLAERTRFGADVVRAVRGAVGEDFVIIMRLSQWKIADYGYRLATSPDELEAWLRSFVDAGTDMFHCSQRRYWEPEFEGSALNFAGWAKKLTGRPTITVGSVGLSSEFMAALRGEESEPRTIDDVAARHARGEFDLVAIGRALLADPSWVRKAATGKLDEFSGFNKEALSTLY